MSSSATGFKHRHAAPATGQRASAARLRLSAWPATHRGRRPADERRVPGFHGLARCFMPHHERRVPDVLDFFPLLHGLAWKKSSWIGNFLLLKQSLRLVFLYSIFRVETVHRGGRARPGLGMTSRPRAPQPVRIRSRGWSRGPWPLRPAARLTLREGSKLGMSGCTTKS